MESREKVFQETLPVEDYQEKATESEPASDRESSVESFHTNQSEISTAAETELIDIDDIELSDEESWLYKSPKKLPQSDKIHNTSEWLLNEAEPSDKAGMLTSTKNALVSKLNQLQILKLEEEKKAKEEMQNKNTYGAVETQITNKTFPCAKVETAETCTPKVSEQTEILKKPLDLNSVKGKENEVLDVIDLQKIAQLQEESLRLSTSRFLTLEKTDGKGFSKNQLAMQNSRLTKPASVDALNVCNGKFEDTDFNLPPFHRLKKINGYGSSSSLHNPQDAHRGSLPIINPGYYSLRTKKSKKQSDKLPFPLPIHPSRLPLNASITDASAYQSHRKLSSPLQDRFESRTLPSSYRTRSNSTSRRELHTPSPRRESSPFLPNQRNSPNLSRRESAPYKHISPLSSPTLYQRSRGGSFPALPSPTKSWRNGSSDIMSPTGSRHASQSPSRRLPLTTMHNRSPKYGNTPVSPCLDEHKGFKVQSRIPSPGPASRSGIPVPASYMARTNSEDESWSNDCY